MPTQRLESVFNLLVKIVTIVTQSLYKYMCMIYELLNKKFNIFQKQNDYCTKM